MLKKVRVKLTFQEIFKSSEFTNSGQPSRISDFFPDFQNSDPEMPTKRTTSSTVTRPDKSKFCTSLLHFYEPPSFYTYKSIHFSLSACVYRVFFTGVYDIFIRITTGTCYGCT